MRGYRHPSRGGGLRAASRVYIRLSEGRQCKKQGVVPVPIRRETTPPDNFISETTPGTTPSKINKYHNFNKLQGQGPPPGTTPKISKIRGWSLTRKNERPPFDNFYIRDHPPGTTPKFIRDHPPETTKLVPTCHHNAPPTPTHRPR